MVSNNTGCDDWIYSDAVAFVRESGKASISAIQRKFILSYNRAALLLDAMEQQGIVTPPNREGRREVVA